MLLDHDLKLRVRARQKQINLHLSQSAKTLEVNLNYVIRNKLFFSPNISTHLRERKGHENTDSC